MVERDRPSHLASYRANTVVLLRTILSLTDSCLSEKVTEMVAMQARMIQLDTLK